MHMANVPPYPGTPRWVKVGTIIVGILILAFVIKHLASGSLGTHAH
jgi:hypothetical protein